MRHLGVTCHCRSRRAGEERGVRARSVVGARAGEVFGFPFPIRRRATGERFGVGHVRGPGAPQAEGQT